MANRDNYLFALSFIAKDESGLALVSAPNATTAFQILKNSGRYNYGPEFYILLRSRNLGLYTCRCAELLLESYTNAEVAYEKFVSIADSFVGPAGEPAGFGSVVATVDDSTGVPYVEVSVTGPDTAKNFSFSFHNLKGADGIDAAVVPGEGQKSAQQRESGAVASGEGAFAEGDGVASGAYSHAEGFGTEATHNEGEHAEGKWNKSNADTISSIGIGTSANDRKNAFEVMKDGDMYVKGVGGYDGTNPGNADDVASVISGKQATLVSGTNIKTVNNQSLLGSGNIEIQGGSDDAVLYTPQSLTDSQKNQARTNIGAGTSSFSGSYNDLSNKPTIPAAQVNSDWSASSGVAQILNKPDIPDPLLTYTESGDVDPTVTPADYATREELDQLEAKVDDITHDTGTPISSASIAEGWKLTGDGLCAADGSTRMVKYLVTAGDAIYLKLSADNPGVYQFQSAASVPSSGTNANLVGSPVSAAIDGFVVVPSGATYLIVSQNNSNTTNEVRTAITYSLSNFNEKITDLDQEVDELAIKVGENITKDITWSNGYISTAGVINSSTASKFTQPFLLKAGERVTVGTTNSNICIIGTTTAQALSVGDTVTVLAKTRQGVFETHSYTAENDIHIVICVRASDYTLNFDYPSNLETRVTSLEERMDDIDVLSYPYERGFYSPVNGNYDSDSSFRTCFIDRTQFVGNKVLAGTFAFVSFFTSTREWISGLNIWNYGYYILNEDNIPQNCASIAISYEKDTKVLRLLSEDLYKSIQRLSPFYPTVRKGSPRYIENNKVSGAVILPTYGASFVRVSIKADPGEGKHFEIGGCLYLSTYWTGSYPVTPSKTVYESNTAELDVRGYEGFCVMIMKKDSSGNTQTLLASDFNREDIAVERVFVPEKLEGVVSYDAYTRNRDKDAMLSSAVRMNKTANGSMDFLSLIITDSHSDSVAELNAVNIANGFQYVQALLHLGDFCASTAGNFDSDVYGKMIACKKPFYFVCGNHDVGNSKTISDCITTSQFYTRYIAPLVSAGLLESGEYTEGEGYYYHDFTEKKIRLVCIYEYDGPDDVSPNDNTKYTYRHGDSIISKAQAQWFCGVLNSTPADYGIIVAMHNPFSALADCVTTAKFNDPAWVDGYGSQRLFSTDLWADIVDAWMNKSANYHCSMVCTGDASYLNVGGEYFSFDYDFSGRNNTAKFLCFIGGHVHRDCVWRHRTYQYQYQITPICANTTNYAQCPNADIRRTPTDGPSKDSLTAIGYDKDNQAIRLVKLGVNVTENMVARDYELIKTQEP